MSQKHLQQLFLKIVKFGYTIGFTSVTWNKSTDSVVYKRSVVRLVSETLQIGILVSYGIFLCYQILVTTSTAKVGNAQKMQIRYAALSWILLTFNPTICIRSGREYARLLNGFRLHVKSTIVPGKTELKSSKFNS